MCERQWWARCGGLVQGPYNTREQAAAALFRIKSMTNIKRVMTGYGTFGPDFDIQWLTREQTNA